jgi:NitT/TauT family transport system substrate-binding protein
MVSLPLARTAPAPVRSAALTTVPAHTPREGRNDDVSTASSWRTARRAGIAAAVSALALVAGCSTNDTTAPAGGGASVAPAPSANGAALVVDAPATTSSSAVFLGSRDGAFSKAGIDVRAHNHTSSDSPLVGLIGHAYPMVWTNAADLLLAVQKNLPVTVVALSDLGQPGQLSVLVKDASPVHSLADLAGRKIGIPGTTSSCAITIPAQLRAAGLDPKSVNLVPVALPDQGSALDRGIVDAVCLPEPFLSIVRNVTATRTVADQFTDQLNGMLVGVYVTTTTYAKDHPDVVAAFRKAIAEQNATLNGDPAALRKAVPTFTQITPVLAAGMKLPTFATEVVDAQPLRQLAGLMQQAGLVEKAELPPGLIAPQD